MRKILALLAIAAMACLVACDPTGGSSGGTSSGTTDTSSTSSSLDLSKAGTVIKSVDFGTVTLPKSLKEETSSSSSSIKKITKGVGDVATLTSVSLPSLKAEGYYKFKDLLDGDSTAVILLNALQTVPSIADGTLASGVTIDTGTLTFSIDGTDVTVSDSGKFKSTLSDDGKTLSCFWSMNFPDFTYGSTDWASYDRIPVKVYFTITSAGIVEAYAYSTATSMNMKYYSKNDLNTNALMEACNTSATISSYSYTSKYSQVVIPNSDGSYSIYYLDEGDGYSYNEIGYANDSFGGVVSAYTSDSYGSSINVEYYDGSGNLVYQGYGQGAASAASNWSWIADYASYSPLNLKTLLGTKPSSFMLRTTYGTSTTYQYSTDGGTSWTTFTPASFGGWAVVYHDTTNDTGSTWSIQTGDAVYWTSAWSSGTDTTSGDWYCDMTYYLGYEVPTAETYFGTDYYVNKSYTLKNLLPLRSTYTGFQVKQKEIATYYSWQDSTSNSWTSATTAPDSGTYVADTLSSWTYYEYWLENVNYKNSSGTDDNDDTTPDTEKGDVQINLTDMQVWYWNSATGNSVSQKTAAFATYNSANLPPYFADISTLLTSAADTKTQLETLYTGKSAYAPSTLLASYDSVMTSALLAQFP